MTTTLGRALHEVLSGEIAALDDVAGATQEELTYTADRQTLVLTSVAVASVLRRYAAGKISATDAQRWAAFVRHGYLPVPSTEAIRPLDIDFEPDHESAIVESIARLDELGDAVDGQLRDGEADRLLRELVGAEHPAPPTNPPV